MGREQRGHYLLVVPAGAPPGQAGGRHDIRHNDGCGLEEARHLISTGLPLKGRLRIMHCDRRSGAVFETAVKKIDPRWCDDDIIHHHHRGGMKQLSAGGVAGRALRVSAQQQSLVVI